MPLLKLKLPNRKLGSAGLPRVLTVAGTLAVLALSGCGAAPLARGHMVGETVAAVLPADLPSFNIPMAAYELSGADLYSIEAAQFRIADQCMMRFGFASTSLPLDRKQMIAEEAESVARLYGIDSLDEARVFGYQPAVVPGASQSEAMPTGSSSYEFVFIGNTAGSIATPAGGWKSPGKFGGLEVPAGGCLGHARTVLWGSPDSEVKDELAQTLRISSYREAEADPRVQALIARWSACMARSGYRYQSPMDPKFNRAQGSGPSPTEIETAIADVTCKKAVDLVSKWNAVDAEYQRRAIDKNRKALVTERRAIREALAKAVNRSDVATY